MREDVMRDESMRGEAVGAWRRVAAVILAVWGGECAWAELSPPEGVLLDRGAVVREAGAVTRERFPDADQVLVNDSILEVVEGDGTSVTWDDEYSKVLTEKGRRAATTGSMGFDSFYGTALVWRVELIKGDGRVVTIDAAKNSKVMIDASQMGMNIYDPSNKELSFSRPGVEVGDVCHTVTVRRESKKRMAGTWCDIMLFEYTDPIVAMDYRVSMPPGLPLVHKRLRAPVGGTVAAEESKRPDGRTVYAWHVRNVPQVFPEPDMPALDTQVQRLMLSTIASWKDVSKWYWGLCKAHLEKVTPEMRETVAKLTEGAATQDEKVRRIFKFVSQEIRYMGITTEEVAPGNEPHDVDMTFKNRYGVCRDKAALLTALLRTAGIPAYPVLFYVGAKRDPDVPMPYFNHAITGVQRPDGSYQLMDATDESTHDLFPPYLGDQSFLVAREDGETLLTSGFQPASRNMAGIETTGVLEQNGSILLKSRLTFAGINDTAYRSFFLRQRAEDRRGFFERLLKARLPGAEVLSCEITPENLQDTDTPLSAFVTSRVRDYPVRGEGLDMLSMPWLGSAVGYANFVIGTTGLERRKYPLKVEISCGVDETVTIDMKAGMGRQEVLPETAAIDRNGFAFGLGYSVSNGVLRARRRLTVDTAEFSPAQYLQLKEDLKAAEAAEKERPLFAAESVHAPDQEVLYDVTEASIQSPAAWTTTSRWAKRILTYAGKKSGAEVRIGFNPACEDVEIISATVSNMNGEVKGVTPKEMNLMDAGWVGEAPRYPAAKTLVINLPGVEVGSVIRIETRLTQTNGWFYSHTQNFGGTVPVLHEEYSLSYPVSMEPRVRLYNDRDVRKLTFSDGKVVRRVWRIDNQSMVKPEPAQPPWHFYRPTLCVSFGDWGAFAGKVKSATDDVVTGKNCACRSARAYARDLVNKISDPHAKLLAIRDEVMRTIRVAGPSFLNLPIGKAFSSPDKTLADHYGHAADRALLLATMLDAVGFDTDILLASGDTTRYPDFSRPSREVPALGYYSSPIVRVKTLGKVYYLNEGDQYSELGTSNFDGGYALSLQGEVVPVEVEEPFKNRGRGDWRVELDEEGTASITITNWYYGTSVSGFRREYSEMLPEDRRRHHLELVSGISQSAVATSALVTDTKAFPGVRAFSVRAPKYATVEGGTMTLLVPDVAGGIFPFNEDTRETPMFVGDRSVSESTCTVVLPPGFDSVQMLPKGYDWTLPNGTGTFALDVREERLDDGRLAIVFTRKSERACGKFPTEFYPSLLEYNRLLSRPSIRTLVVRRH
jgi:transglutaminase-like putative cysteine protease